MTGGDSYVKDGWVHNLKMHHFIHEDNPRYVIIGKVYNLH